MHRQQYILNWWACLSVSAAMLSGCASFSGGRAPSNPMLVSANNHELVWERAIDVLHANLFEIERENRLDGLIESKYKTGAGLLEPWHPDSVGLANRLDGTFQSIRRKAYITVTPAEGGYLVGVEAYKELEDVAGAANSAGAATFLDNNARPRDLQSLVGQAAPSGWLAKGRDLDLEQHLIDELSVAFRR